MMLRVALSNGLRPAANRREPIRALERAFDGLDNAEERVINSKDIMSYEQVDDDTAGSKTVLGSKSRPSGLSKVRTQARSLRVISLTLLVAIFLMLMLEVQIALCLPLSHASGPKPLTRTATSAQA